MSQQRGDEVERQGRGKQVNYTQDSKKYNLWVCHFMRSFLVSEACYIVRDWQAEEPPVLS